tara:strand:- start:873 stop:3128 length:2256 start_codon:yes stop_codon:yes gene_type:complete
MALNFYNTVDLQENQLLRAAINNVSGEPADGARGELIYDYATGVNKLKVCTTASTSSSNAVWAIVGDGTGVDSVSGVEPIFIGGTAADPTVNLRYTATASQTNFIDKATSGGSVVTGSDRLIFSDQSLTNNVVKYATVSDIVALAPQGDITSVEASSADNRLGIAIDTGTDTGPTPKVGVDIIGQTKETSLADDDSVLFYDLNQTKNLRFELSDLKSYIGAGDVEGIDAGAGIVVNDAATTTPEVAVLYTGATNVVQSASDAEGSAIATTDVILYSDSNASDAVKRGLVSDLPFSTSTYTKWILKDNQSTPVSSDVDSGDTVIVAGGTVINSAVTMSTGSPRTVTINHDDLTVTTTDGGADSPGYGGSITVVTSVTGTSQGHLDTITTKDLTLPASVNTTYALDKAANDNTLILSADGSTQDSIEFTGTASQIDIDVASEDAYTFSFPSTGFTAPDGSVATTQSSGDNSTKLATTAFVQTALTSALKFVDGFNANSGDLDSSASDLYTDLDVTVGDFFVVTTPGNFFGNASTPLTNGDQVICIETTAAGSVQESDFVVVQSDTDLATYAAPGLANVNIGDDADSSQVPSGFVGSTNGTATGGPLQIVYNGGTAILSSRLATSSLVGLGNVVAGSGIGISYSNGTATITNSAQSESRFKKVSLNSGLSYVSASSSGGVTTFEVDVTSSSVLGSGTDPMDVKCEIVKVSDGETVFAEIDRDTSGTKIRFKFVEQPSGTQWADSTFNVLMVNVG